MTVYYTLNANYKLEKHIKAILNKYIQQNPLLRFIMARVEERLHIHSNINI